MVSDQSVALCYPIRCALTHLIRKAVQSLVPMDVQERRASMSTFETCGEHIAIYPLSWELWNLQRFKWITTLGIQT